MWTNFCVHTERKSYNRCELVRKEASKRYIITAATKTSRHDRCARTRYEPKVIMVCVCVCVESTDCPPPPLCASGDVNAEVQYKHYTQIFYYYQKSHSLAYNVTRLSL